VDQEVVDYIADIRAEHRPLFERVHGLILEACPQADVTLSYGMPTYRLGKGRLNVAAWRHGISIYGWKASGDGGLSDRHPELRTGAGTIQLRTDQADAVSDDEFRALARHVLGT
jgi:uncharacterized protein YdhG (YjbR/CyaY superfamily)